MVPVLICSFLSLILLEIIFGLNELAAWEQTEQPRLLLTELEIFTSRGIFQEQLILTQVLGLQNLLPMVRVKCSLQSLIHLEIIFGLNEEAALERIEA